MRRMTDAGPDQAKRPHIQLPDIRPGNQAFWPQLVTSFIGLGFLVTLLFLLGVGGSAWEKTLSGILAATGLSLAGLTGILKNSAQAMLKRLRQDSDTDLVAIAVQTAPPPGKSDLQATGSLIAGDPVGIAARHIGR